LGHAQSSLTAAEYTPIIDLSQPVAVSIRTRTRKIASSR
jgi:hypothetical protein